MNKPCLRFCVFAIICFTLFSMESNAQQPTKDYQQEWKKVEDFLKKNLPQSALADVKKIYALAKADKQDAQLIKSLVYMGNLQQQTREQNEEQYIREVEKELAESREPVTSVLSSHLAGLYWQYYNQHRWQLYSRTATINFEKDDIATWSTEDFHRRIGELFLHSVKEEKLLQQTRLEPFNAIIEKGNMRHLRPTLYDLLVHRALTYFQSDERDIQRPAYRFEINQAAAFDPAADFIHRRFATEDASSLQYQALLLYQKLLAFHLDDKKPDALVDADIARIRYVYSVSVHPDKDQQYLNALNHLTHQYNNLPVVAQASYLLAAYHYNKASSYTAYGDSTHRLGKAKAKDICEKVLAQKDSSEGKTNCFNLLKEITLRSLQFEVEKVNLPNQPFRALISYQNLNRLYLRLIKVDDKLKTLLEDQYNKNFWPAITAAKPVRSWEQALPTTSDFHTHHTEIKIDALPVGQYVLVASPNKNFTDKSVLIGARSFHVSSISFITNSQSDYFVLNRDNGQPLAQATVQVWQKKYDYRLSKNVNERYQQYTTDANGYFRIDKKGTENDYVRGYFLDIRYGNDRLDVDQARDYYYYNPGNAESVPGDNSDEALNKKTSTFLFTDRSIYRPGQTVYVKGIAVLDDKDKINSVRSGYTTWIQLLNANWEKIDSVKVTTNEYGSFSTRFQLPEAALNGSFLLQMQNKNGMATIQVEEYKRPKFYVDYEALKGTYKVNDRIKLTGIAKAYAGNNIDGATVKYRVVREPRFMYPWMFWKWWQPPTAPMEIAHGETTTDKDGKFFIEFTAIPDLTIDKKFEPVFDYRVYADVTDISGETRSGEKLVSVSDKSLLLKVNIDERLATDSLQKISIRTENMNGEYEPAIVNVKIIRLKEEQRLIRPRYWQRPDQFTMSKQEYVRYFPYDEYDNESDSKSWEKGEVVFEKNDSASSTGQWAINHGRFTPGFYTIEISTKDKDGKEVKDIKYVELYDEKSNQLSHSAYLWSIPATPAEPGEKTRITLGTATDNVFIIQQVDKTKGRGSTTEEVEKRQFSFFQLNQEKRAYEFVPTEEDRGGFGVAYAFVKHNRFFKFDQVITVPWTSKDLQIEYGTYRDKTLPGSTEKWTIKLSGYKKEKVAAEMLASMYDASLDQFVPHAWISPAIWPYYSRYYAWDQVSNFSGAQAIVRSEPRTGWKTLKKEYDEFVLAAGGNGGVRRNYARADMSQQGEMFFANAMITPDRAAAAPLAKAGSVSILDGDKSGVKEEDSGDNTEQGPEVQVRKNFNETAFFIPDLKTDDNGNIEFSFTLPEALTKWKFQALAHTKELAFGYSSKEIVTQKQLMVQPNAPRFLREGDKIELSTKVVNLTENELSGQAELQLIDAATNVPVNNLFKNVNTVQSFTVAAGQSVAVKYPVDIPASFNSTLLWRIVARAKGKQGDVSDGEENLLPVLSNRLLVTESIPLHIRGNGTKEFSFDKLLQSGSSKTLQHQSLTVEYSSNPAWYAVQSLPYMMEYPYECAEQLWNRYYANSLGTMLANSSPRIKQVFEQWKNADTAALLSNLQKNQELKSVLLEETPWVLQAKSEAEQKRNIALLFDMVKMSTQLNNSYERLKQLQSSNGGFVWFNGGPDDRFVTQYIVSGIGHLKKLNAIAPGQADYLNSILTTALPYLDKKLKEDYDELVKQKADLKKQTPSSFTIQYLYMRSFFPEHPIAAASKTAYAYFRERAQQTWTSQNKYLQGMVALALHRTNDAATPAAILQSLKETSITNEEMGMYWKDAGRSWWWHEAPIERQALLIEAFSEIAKDTRTVNDLRTWLLKNKQTNNWESTKATAEACYALLLQGTEWLAENPVVTINLGRTVVKTDDKKEAGTGYFKQTIEGETVRPDMGKIKLRTSSSKSDAASWGAVYWQYFEDMDKITTAATPLKLEKKLFVETNTDRGPVLTPVTEGSTLKVGDKIKVRIELRVDRDMEYVHMKDLRAAGMEPVNVLSSYKWQGGLGYYETTRDAGTHFFFSQLRKGTYVFEYPLFVTHTGDFSNGITSIQCMYAPEFSAHSEGIRVVVK